MSVIADVSAHANRRGYLAAMIDGEGCVGKYVPGKSQSRRVVIANTELDIIDACVECLEALGIPYNICARSADRPEWSDSWAINITCREGFQKLVDIPIRSRRKRERLAEIVASYRFNPPATSAVVALYEAGNSMRAIGDLCGCSDNSIRNILVKVGVERRGRGPTRNKAA